MLDHPNICAVYSVEETEGRSFIVMHYVEGESLSRLISERHPDMTQTIAIARQIVGALAEAHAHGIIHRDVKPQNVLVTRDGQVKVLDFGLAKVVRQADGDGADSQVSQAGLVVGTVSYMSPEQLRAERLDFRSDIFSLGTVLYELITGANPFTRASHAETTSAILTYQPPLPARPGADFPQELGRIVLKCLCKEKEQRYQSASELHYELNLLGAGGTAPRRWPRVRPHAVAAFVVFLILTAALFVTYLRQTRIQRLAILPVAQSDSTLEYMSNGLTESLINKLNRMSHLRVKAATAVAGYKAREADPREVGRELQVDAVLVGELIRQGETVVLAARLLDTSDGSELWSATYSVSLEQIFELQKEVAENITRALDVKPSAEEEKHLARTHNPRAFEQNMRGRYYLSRRDPANIEKSIEHFEEALAIEADYAEAHAGLAECYVFLSSPAYGHLPPADAMRKAKAAANLALKLDDRLPEAHTSVGVVYLRHDWKWDEAEREFKRAIEINPDYAPAHYWYSNLLAITGRPEDSIAESEVAKRLDPTSPSTSLNRCRAYFLARRHDEAAGCFQEMLDADPNNDRAKYILGLVYQQKGMFAEAIKIHRELAERNLNLAASALGWSYGRTGRRAEALKILEELNALKSKEYVSAIESSIIYAGLGDKDNAFALLDKAYEERFISLPYLPIEPLFDGLRDDPRYLNLLHRLDLMPR
jgi:TolB-like protein